jgi:hypothetical protein
LSIGLWVVGSALLVMDRRRDVGAWVVVAAAATWTAALALDRYATDPSVGGDCNEGHLHQTEIWAIWASILAVAGLVVLRIVARHRASGLFDRVAFAVTSGAVIAGSGLYLVQANPSC